MLDLLVLAALKAAAGKAGGSALRIVWDRLYDREGRAEREVVAMTSIRAIDKSLPEGAQPDEKWAKRAGRRFIAPLIDKNVASHVLEVAIADPDNVEKIRETLEDALEAKAPWWRRLRRWWKRRRALQHDGGGNYISELATKLGFDAEQFLFVFSSTVIDELCMAGARKGSPLFERALLARQGQFVSRVSADRVPRLSPADLRVQLIQFLDEEEDWHHRMLARLPFMPRGRDPESLRIEPTCRVSSWRGLSDVAGGDATMTGLPRGRASDRHSATIPLSALLASEPLIVVLADAGIGKTWLTHIHAAQFARQAREQLQTAQQPPSEITIPVAMRCSLLAKHDTRDLAEAAGHELAERRRLAPALRHWLTEHFRTNACVSPRRVRRGHPRTARAGPGHGGRPHGRTRSAHCHHLSQGVVSRPSRDGRVHRGRTAAVQRC
jgi:hypothetical protein